MLFVEVPRLPQLGNCDPLVFSLPKMAFWPRVALVSAACPSDSCPPNSPQFVFSSVDSRISFRSFAAGPWYACEARPKAKSPHPTTQ